jgi:lysophospholipase L1-like esterase
VPILRPLSKVVTNSLTSDNVRGVTAPRRVLASSLAALALGAASVLGASSASGAPRDRVVYDALGDSYASGYGVPPYDGACGRSQAAYAEQLDGRMRIALDDFAACAGATTQTLVSRGQLAALDADTDLVTLTIGGNDTSWGDAVGACLYYDDLVCDYYLGRSLAVVANDLPGLLDGVYTQVRAGAPHAHVVVTGYPRLFSPEYGGYLMASPADQRRLNAAADLLDSVIKARAEAHGFQYVDVRKRFDGHGVNAPEPYVLGPGPGSFHPNVEGYEAYTAALTSQINPTTLR